MPDVVVDTTITNFLDFLKSRGYSERTLDTYKRAITEYIKFRGDKPEDRRLAMEYVSQLHNSPRSVNTYLSALSSWFSFRRMTDPMMMENIFADKNIRATNPEELPQPLSNKEINAIFSQLEPEYLPYYRLMLYGGLRVSEAISVKQEDFILKNGVRWLKVRGKGNKERIVPLLTSKEIDLNSKSISQDKIKCYTYRLAKKTGIALHCHRLRHTFATNALNKGVRIEIISKWLGHSNVATTNIYAQISDKTSENAARLCLK